MKVRLMAVMAVAVVGVMAGTSPAMAAKKKAKTSVSKSWQNQHKDNKVFGDAINNLRKASDETNFSVSTLAGAAVEALGALKDGLTTVAGSYTNFEYGVVQVINPDGTPAAGSFLATPRIDPTVEQATVTGQFAVGVGGVHKLSVAVRSANPAANDKTSTVVCRVTGSLANGGFVTSAGNAGLQGLPFWPVSRSNLVPAKGAPSEATFPVSLTPYDNVVDMTAAGNSAGALAAAGATANGAGVLHVTLSCLSMPKS
jgi:hypothetical protein